MIISYFFRYVLILSFHINLRLSGSHFPSHICRVYILPVRATPPAQLKSPWLNHSVINILWRVQSMKILITQLPTVSCYYFSLKIQIFSSGPCCPAPSISSLRDTGQVSYATVTVVLYVFICMFLNRRLTTSKHSSNLIWSSTYSYMPCFIFICCSCFRNFARFTGYHFDLILYYIRVPITR